MAVILVECLFCKIVDGSVPSKKVYEDENVLCFLDINPANPGHTLVISKKHFENIFDADNEILESMINTAKIIANRLKERLGAEGVNIIQNNGREAGQLVNHIHIHVIPRYKHDKVMITYPRAKMEKKDFDEIQKKLQEETNDNEDMDDDFDW